MKYYSEFTEKYVEDICNALNQEGILKDKGINQKYSPDKFEYLEEFIKFHVVMPMHSFNYLNEKGLVNRGKCPYTGEKIDKSTPKWTFMSNRSIYLSHEGMRLMKQEDEARTERSLGYKPKEKLTQNSDAGNCYIATVCYGSPYAYEVTVFKRFRDEVLLKYLLGKYFVSIYYFFSPYIAYKLQNKNTINNIIKVFLNNLLNLIKKYIR